MGGKSIHGESQDRDATEGCQNVVSAVASVAHGPHPQRAVPGGASSAGAARLAAQWLALVSCRPTLRPAPTDWSYTLLCLFCWADGSPDFVLEQHLVLNTDEPAGRGMGRCCLQATRAARAGHIPAAAASHTRVRNPCTLLSTPARTLSRNARAQKPRRSRGLT